MVGHKREEFTYDYYREFIYHLREVCQFTTFREGKRITGGVDKPLVIMRHDIDMDLEAALRMASLEKDLRIDSTYFFMVRCSLYNVFSSNGSEQVKQILVAGHHFGLHFDCSIYEDISADNLNRYISKECQLLEQFFEQPVEAISFHRPGRLELSGVELEKWPNSYERVFVEEFEYFSDSRGNWARGNPLESEAFFNRKNFHILVHPIWWTVAPMSTWECLISLVQRIRHQTEQYLSENCEVWSKAKQLSS